MRYATTPEERTLVNIAIDASDNEIDLAFADAIRNAQQHPPPPTPEDKLLSSRVQSAFATVQVDKDYVHKLMVQMAHAGPSQRSGLEAQLSLLRAQLELDQDALQDAKNDLT